MNIENIEGIFGTVRSTVQASSAPIDSRISRQAFFVEGLKVGQVFEREVEEAGTGRIVVTTDPKTETGVVGISLSRMDSGTEHRRDVVIRKGLSVVRSAVLESRFDFQAMAKILESAIPEGDFPIPVPDLIQTPAYYRHILEMKGERGMFPYMFDSRLREITDQEVNELSAISQKILGLVSLSVSSDVYT